MPSNRAQPPVASSSRNRIFDLARLFFATCVLLSHAAELTDGSRARELLANWTDGGISFGAFGVCGFFLLSGYLITQSWLSDPHWANYLKSRFLRILPGYVVAVLLSVLAVGLLAPAAPHFFHLPGKRALLSVLLLGVPQTSPVLRGIGPGLSTGLVNGSLWTIAYEFRCYLLLLLAGAAGLLRRRVVMLILTLALVACSHLPAVTHDSLWTMHQPWEPDVYWTFRLTSFFAAGCCYYLFRDRVGYRPALACFAFAGLAAVALTSPKHFELGLLAFGSYLFFYLSRCRFAWLQGLRLPDISYGVYLYGWPVESLWIYFHHGSPWVTFAASLVICLGLGWLSWHFVERPMLRLKRRSSTALPPG